MHDKGRTPPRLGGRRLLVERAADQLDAGGRPGAPRQGRPQSRSRTFNLPRADGVDVARPGEQDAPRAPAPLGPSAKAETPPAGGRRTLPWMRKRRKAER